MSKFKLIVTILMAIAAGVTGGLMFGYRAANRSSIEIINLHHINQANHSLEILGFIENVDIPKAKVLEETSLEYSYNSLNNVISLNEAHKNEAIKTVEKIQKFRLNKMNK
jgi:hypothetical protein